MPQWPCRSPATEYQIALSGSPVPWPSLRCDSRGAGRRMTRTARKSRQAGALRHSPTTLAYAARSSRVPGVSEVLPIGYRLLAWAANSLRVAPRQAVPLGWSAKLQGMWAP